VVAGAIIGAAAASSTQPPPPQTTTVYMTTTMPTAAPAVPTVHAMAAPQVQPSLATMQVQLPPGAKPGQHLQLQTPDGQMMMVVVPDGFSEGMTMQVQYMPQSVPTATGVPLV